MVDCLRDEENALLVEPGDVDALAGALGRMLNDVALRRRLADAALAEVRTTYAWPTIAGRIEDVYRDLRGTVPDTDWSLPPQPPDACRFRAEPHLL